MKIGHGLAFVVVLASAAASASLVVPDDKTLAEVVAASDTIVVVKTSKAMAHATKISIGGGEFATRTQNPWEVTAVLRGDAKLVGQLIYVDSYAWEFNVAMSRAIREKQPTPSPIFPRYPSLHKKPLEANEPRVLFLRKEDGGAFIPPMMEAIESVKYLDQIKAAIAAGKKP